MRLVKRHPFVVLAIVTIAIGALWHSTILPASVREPLSPVVTAIGYPFISAMRFVNRNITPSAWSPVIGTLLGLAPYVLADWFWRRRHRTA